MKAGQALIGGSGAVLEAPGVVACLDDLAVVCEPVEQRGGHLGVAEDGRPFAEGEIGGDDDGSALIEPANQVEEKLAIRYDRCVHTFMSAICIAATVIF